MDAKHSLGEPRVLISVGTASQCPAASPHAARRGAHLRDLKADAYGHGAASWPSAVQGPGRPGRGCLAVASLDEAEALPEVPLPVIIFRPVENVFIGRQRQKLEAAIRDGLGAHALQPRRRR